MVGDPGKLSLDDLFVEALHVVGAEGRHQGAHLVQDAAKRPNVALAVVGLVAPHLWTRVVRSACLRVTQALLHNFRDVKIAKLRLHVFEQEQVCTLHIPVQNAPHVESSQAPDDLYKDVPDLLLLDVGLALLVVTDFLEHVTVVCVLHDQAETRCRLVNKGISVGDHIWVIDRSQNTHLIQGVFFLFFRQGEHFHILECIDAWIVLPLDLEYGTVGAVAEFLDDCEVRNARALPQRLIIRVRRLL